MAEARWRLDMEGGAITAVSNLDVDNADDVSVGSGGSFAVGGGYRLVELAELTAQFQASFTTPAGLIDQLDVYSFTAGARVYPVSWGRFHPWLIGQIGWYRADAEELDYYHHHYYTDSVEEEDAFGFNAGGGFDVTVNRRVSIGVDVRYHRLIDAFGGFGFLTPMVNVALYFGGGAATSGTP